MVGVLLGESWTPGKLEVVLNFASEMLDLLEIAAVVVVVTVVVVVVVIVVVTVVVIAVVPLKEIVVFRLMVEIHLRFVEFFVVDFQGICDDGGSSNNNRM